MNILYAPNIVNILNQTCIDLGLNSNNIEKLIEENKLNIDFVKRMPIIFEGKLDEKYRDYGDWQRLLHKKEYDCIPGTNIYSMNYFNSLAREDYFERPDYNEIKKIFPYPIIKNKDHVSPKYPHFSNYKYPKIKQENIAYFFYDDLDFIERNLSMIIDSFTFLKNQVTISNCIFFLRRNIYLTIRAYLPKDFTFFNLIDYNWKNNLVYSKPLIIDDHLMYETLENEGQEHIETVRKKGIIESNFYNKYENTLFLPGNCIYESLISLSISEWNLFIDKYLPIEEKLAHPVLKSIKETLFSYPHIKYLFEV